jgi:ATP-dependent 26S proteasome regulatory subunit
VGHRPGADFEQLKSLLDSKTAIVLIESHEEAKVLTMLERFCLMQERRLWRWSVTDGLRPANGLETAYNTTRIVDALRHIEKSPANAIYLFLDAHKFIEDPVVLRQIRDIVGRNEWTHRMLVFLSPRMELPEELSRMTARFKPALPGAQRVGEILNEEARRYRESSGAQVKATQEALNVLVQHLAGLTEEDVRRLARMAIRDDGAITAADIAAVLKAKHDMLGAGAALALEPGVPDIDELGGLAALKRWLKVRREVFMNPSAGSPLPPPKGALLLGVQGAGKSLAAKCIAGAWQLPLFRMDFGALYQKYHGETERNIREALAAAEAMSPCVLWMDEIEKGIAADAGADADGGVSRRVLGTLLTWMSERTSRVFLVATANDIARLPPELLRKGRFDEIFFVDLPQSAAREDIVRIHLRRNKQDPAAFDLKRLAAASEGFAGAEIEQAIVAALYEAHAEKKPLDADAVEREMKRTRPLSVVMAEKIAELRAWARERTVPAD